MAVAGEFAWCAAVSSKLDAVGRQGVLERLAEGVRRLAQGGRTKLAEDCALIAAMRRTVSEGLMRAIISLALTSF